MRLIKGTRSSRPWQFHADESRKQAPAFDDELRSSYAGSLTLTMPSITPTHASWSIVTSIRDPSGEHQGNASIRGSIDLRI